MPVRVIGVKMPSFSAVRRGSPDSWAPAEGGELEDLKVFSGSRLPPKIEDMLLTDESFIRAVEAAI